MLNARITVYSRSRWCAVLDWNGHSRQFESLSAALEWLGPATRSVTVIFT